MASIIYPVGILTDNAGAPLIGATVTIAAVQNPTSGAPIVGHGATVNNACQPFCSVNYDAVAHGEAVITLLVALAGRTITGVNASPILYCAVDSSLIDTALPNASPGGNGGLPTVNANNQIAGLAGPVRTSYAIIKNTLLNGFEFVMLSNSTHLPLAGLGSGITAQVSRDGSVLGAATNTPAEIGNGIYYINLSAADLNGNSVTLRFSAAGADDTIITMVTQA